MAYRKDVTGMRFGELTAIKVVGKTKGGNLVWLCVCDCGNYREVQTCNLIRGRTKNCGKHMGYRHHGFRYTKLYSIYSGMISRCNNPKNIGYDDYGGRGIKVCDEWSDKKTGKASFFEWAISNGYKEGLSLDREDVNGDYTPENCHWVDKSYQSFNRRRKDGYDGPRGVYYIERVGKYLAVIGKNNKSIHLGYFKNIDDAVFARKQAELEYYGKTLDD